jgi:hypothetical protein
LGGGFRMAVVSYGTTVLSVSADPLRGDSLGLGGEGSEKPVTQFESAIECAGKRSGMHPLPFVLARPGGRAVEVSQLPCLGIA